MCLPSIYDMDKSAAIHRSQFLIHVYLKNGKRGYFRFYGKKAKARLFGNDFARRTYQYLGRSTFWGTFKKGYVIDEKKYRAKKDMVLKKYLPTEILETPSITKKKDKPDIQIEQIVRLHKIQKMSFMKLEEMGFGDRKKLAKQVRDFDAGIGGGQPIYYNNNNAEEKKILETI